MPKKAAAPPDPDKLQRESAGSYRSGDDRFLVTSQGGEWFVTDTERVDDFGLEMIVGPVGTLADAKVALAGQRDDPQGHTFEERDQLAKKAAAEVGRTGTARKRRAMEPPPRPRPAPKPEPPPEPTPQPAARVRAARWRKRGDARDEVAAALRRINDAWTRGEPDAAGDDLHPDVLFVQPDFGGHTQGRELVVESYREFMTEASVAAYEESGLEVFTWHDTAVATYRWSMDYTIAGERHVEVGHDVFAFTRSSGRWLAAWRLLQVGPDE